MNQCSKYTFVHMVRQNPQLRLLKNMPKSYGGELLKTRQGRSHGRPIDTKNTMHLILRSSKAKGEWSFWKPRNKASIQRLVTKFSGKFGIKVMSMANVGNHLHFQIKVNNRFTYLPFIRALTSAIAMAVTGVSRWNPTEKRENLRDADAKPVKNSFWDYRPFTSVVIGLRAFLTLKEYININRLLGFGLKRDEVRFFLGKLDLKAGDG